MSLSSGGGDGQMDLNTGKFTCITPGHYTITYSADALYHADKTHVLFLYLNEVRIYESRWFQEAGMGYYTETEGMIHATGSRTVVGYFANLPLIYPPTLDGRSRFTLYILMFLIFRSFTWTLATPWS